MASDAIVEAAGIELLTQDSLAAVVEAFGIEALTQDSPAAVVEAFGLEVLMLPLSASRRGWGILV